ncbi:MAG TPA: LamG-like jellyroll fold domain-containing protein [Fluviicola sp.]|nr:LamG-like jellyroll fold domain-containing protein [Fluviicola sp.]
MRKYYVTFLAAMLAFIGNSQVLQWGSAVGSTGSDFAFGNCVDAFGNVYTVGTFLGTVDFNPGAAVNNLTAMGGNDAFIQKLDANGNFVFAYNISGTGTEIARSIAVAPNGLIYVGGSFSGSPDFNNGVGNTIVTSNGLSDGFVMCLNPDGTFSSVAPFGGTGDDIVHTVCCNNGAFCAGGTFQNTVDFNPGSGVTNLTASGTSGFLARFTGGSSLSWAYVSGTGVYGSGMDASGNIYSTGSFTGTFDFNFTASVGNLTSAGGSDIFIQKVNSTGAPGFARSYGGSGNDVGLGLKFDASANIYNSGYFNGTADFDPSAGTFTLTSAGGNDAYASKLNTVGDLIWATGFGGTGDDRATVVDYDPINYVYCAGYFNGTVDFDPGAGTTNYTAAGGTDAFVSKFNPTGTFQWANPISSTLDDAIAGLNTSATSGIYLSGYHAATIDVDPSAGTTNLTTAGLRDVFVAKWTPCATLPAVTNTTSVANVNICEGNSTVLSATGLGTISWYSAASGGTYLGAGTTFNTGILNANTSFFVQDSTCVPSARTQIMVSVQPPIVSQTVSAGAASVCSGQSTTVSITSSEVNKQYYLRNNADNSIVAGPVNGTGSSINISTGPITATTTYNVYAVSSPVNNALDLDGTNDYVDFGTNSRGITNAITVSARVRATVNGASQFIVDKYLSGGIGYYLYINATGYASFQGRDVAGAIKSSGFSTTMVADNQWHELTGVVRGGIWEIWVDGVLQSSGTYSIGATGLGTTASLLVGQFGGTYSALDIDRVAIWNAALSSATILDNASNCLNGGEANLVGYFPFSETSGTTTADLSPNALNGTLINMTSPACWITGLASQCASGCTSEMSNTVTVNVIAAPAQPTITASGPTALCSGGSVTLTSSAGTSYLWSTGATTASIVVSTAGTYTVQVTNASGCQSVASAGTTVTVGTPPAQPTISAGGPTTFCAGGSVTLTSSAGTSYLWSNGATTASINATTAGTYTVQVTNAAGCQSVASAGTTVTVNAAPAAPTISAGGPTTFCAGGSVTLTSSAGTSYLWSNGATTASINATTAGTYTVQVTNAAGCQSTASAGTTVTVNALPATPTISAGGPTTFCAGGSVTLTSSAGTSYLWSNGATTASINATTAGTYTVQVTNAAGCQSAASAGTTVTVNALPATPTISAGGPTTFCAGGSVALTSSAGTSYLWSNGATTASINATTAGTYTVQVTNAAGCQSAASTGTTVTVNALPATPTISAGGPTTFCAGGSVTLTSSAGTSYLWSNGATTASVNATTAGTYTVQVTNAAGCQSAASSGTTITVNALPNTPIISPNGPTTFCQGGTVNLASSAGITYLWSTGATTASIDVTNSGNYSVQITGPNGCQSPASAVAVVTVNPTPAIALGTVTNPASCTINDGSIQITGTGTGDLSWTGTASGSMTGITLPATISALSDGAYNITFTNAFGCASNVLNTSLSAPAAPPAPTITAGGGTTFCDGGSVTLTSSAGTSYLWSSGETTASIVVSAAGNYSVSITDASGCSSPASTATTIVVNALPIITPGTVTDPVSCITSDGSIEVAGTETGDLSWSGAASGNLTATTLPVTIPGLGQGNYTVTFTDANGCTSTDLNVTLVAPGAPSAPTITPDGPTTFCEGGSVTLTSTAAASYQWSNGETTQSITVNADGAFSVIITDANGCTSPSSSSTTVNVDQMPDLAVSTVNNVITANQANATYQWVDCNNGNQPIAGETGISFAPAANGSYAVIITSGTCSGMSACETISTIGMEEQSLLYLGVQPNPGYELVRVTSAGTIQEIVILSMQGEHVRTEYQSEFSVRDLARGIYLLKVKTTEGTGTVRLAVE